MSEFKKLTKSITDFRDARNWKQFHNAKDMALSLTLEAAEVLEHFQWKNADEMERYVKESKEAVAEELADVLYWVLLMAHDLHIDVVKAFAAKMRKNRKKYPVRKSRNSHKKYNQLS